MSAQAPAVPDASPQRTAELGARLDTVRNRIAAAVAASPGRDTAPELIVVTKYFPASDVLALQRLGVRSVGENRDQEAAAKAAGLDGLELDWHFIGQLQTNKAKSVVRYAHAVHSVDRPSLVGALARAMDAEQQRRAAAGQEPRAALECYLQVDLSAGAAAGRGGADPALLPELAGLVTGSDGLRLAGLMAVAPLGADPAPAFARLAELSALLRQDFPAATGISAGMSADLEEAVRHGATHLRVGSDVLGPRPPVR